MDHLDATQHFQFERLEYRNWLNIVWRPIAIAAVVVSILLLIIVAASHSAWSLLGIGRGFVPEALYPVSGFAIVFALTFGHAVAWAIGSSVVFYIMTLLGSGANWATTRIAMGVAYLALGPLPLLAFHIFYGGTLLGMPRAGLGEWLAAEHPGASWLLLTGHPIIDFSLIPLGLIFLGLLWKYSEAPGRERAFQTALALCLLGTSLAVALSIAIHSILAHTRIGS
ncbi:MAG: hypothetical protein ACREO5_01060 [Candidatus Binatia bacterium]